MSILINVHNLEKSFGSRMLFSGVNFGIESGDRIGLIGPNGAGKSTLLKILAGQTATDGGQVSTQKGLRIGMLEQVPQFTREATVEQTLTDVLQDPHDWQEMARVQELMSRLNLSGDVRVAELSGGWQKRVALARELARHPDLLLLDEPTNHLDIASIRWIEDLLTTATFATLTVTHDRAFLQKVSNRILELDRRNPQGLLDVKGGYADYLTAKEQLLSAQQRLESKLKNTLRRETEWLRRGAMARQTKQQARLQKAAELKETVEELSSRNATSQVRLDFVGAGQKPKRLIEAKGISKSYDDRVVVPPTDVLIQPKTRLGLLGPNGCGKSTLIKLLLQKEKSDTGEVFHSEHLQVAYFEQNRETLDPNLSVIQTLCPSGDFVDHAGKPVHVRGYLSRFLFDPQQMEMPVGRLSGGEQSRLLLARLMLSSANVLILDEPTNDLDMATLNVLEDMLKEFAGAVILVTHDRYFLDQVSTEIRAFITDPLADEKQLITFATVEQWEQWEQGRDEDGRRHVTEREETTKQKNGPRLSNKDRERELAKLTTKIEVAEAELQKLVEESQHPDAATNPSKLMEMAKLMEQAQFKVDELYAKWERLEQQ